MPYLSNAEKEAAGWISQTQAIEHIRKVDGCNESEARRQLHNAMRDHPELVHPEDWGFQQAGTWRIPSQAEIEAHWAMPSKRLRLQLVLSLWPEHAEPAPIENNNNKLASGAERCAPVEDRRGRRVDNAVRRHKPEIDAELGNRVRAVLRAARRRWPNEKTWALRPMAKELARLGEGQGYEEAAIRKILQGTYPPACRLKIKGLRG
jgi:hypothetical protein